MKNAPRARQPGPRAGTRGPVMFAFLHAAQRIQGRMEESLAKVGLSGAKFAALTKLVDAGQPLPLAELASRLTCVRSNITQLVDRLEADGLVERVEDPGDRRSVRAALTPLGRRRQAAGALRMAALQRTLDRVLSGVDRRSLENAIAKLG